MHVCAERHTDDGTHLKFEEEQDYWEGSGEDLDMHGDEEEADMRAEEELMMQHRYMMVCMSCVTGISKSELARQTCSERLDMGGKEADHTCSNPHLHVTMWLSCLHL